MRGKREEPLRGLPDSFGVRPEDLTLTDGPGLFTGTVSIIEKLGEVTLVYLDTGLPEPITVKIDGDVEIAKGATLTVTAPADRLHLFDENGVAFPRMRLSTAAA